MSQRSARNVLPLSLCLLATLGCPGLRSTPPHVIVISIDTLRADHVGFDGRAPFPTPALDRIAAEGAWASHAFAPFARTTQSVGSLLTGNHPIRHGADGLGMELSAENQTLAELLGAHGYRSAAFVSNLFLQAGRGFEQGFTIFSNPSSRWHRDSAEEITSEALAWVNSARAQDGPLLLWAHYLDPHWPYEPPADDARRADPDWSGEFEFFDKVFERGSASEAGQIQKGAVIFQADQLLKPREIDHLRRLYAAEVLATDRAVGRLWDGLQQAGLLDRAIVLITADHGESLGEHRYWFAHGEYLYDETLRVPWIVWARGLIPPGTRLEGNVNLIDSLPTILGLAGFEPPRGLDGLDLSTLLKNGGTAPVPPRLMLHLADHHLVRQENPRREVPGRAGRWCAVRDGTRKWIGIPQAGGTMQEEFYELDRDPTERENRIAVAAQLDPYRELCRAVPTTGPGEEVDPFARESAENLGYAGGSTPPPARTP